MKKLNLFGLVLISFYLLFSCTDDNSVDPIEKYESEHTDGLSNDYITELNEIITPLNSCDPLGSLDDLDALNSLGNAKIVGLGEATHGTKEFFQLKHKIFRYLVENHNFKIFAFECDMGESVYIDRYITKGEGSLNDIMLNKMHFWTWRTTEVAELISWMKEYNENRAEGDKIHLIGDDCQYLSYQADLVKEFLKDISHNRTKLDELIEYINAIPAIERRETLLNSSYTERKILHDLVEESIIEFQQHKEELTKQHTEFEYEVHLRLIININQFLDALKDQLYIYRDLYMAENAIWSSNLFGGCKVAIWAHNGHVAKDKNYAGDISQGAHIFETIGTNYKVVGFSFTKGKFIARGYSNGASTASAEQSITVSPQAGSLNEIFFNAKMDNFILDFSNMETNSELYTFCRTRHNLLSIGAVFNNNPTAYYKELVISVHYDFMINYDFTSAADPY